MHMFPKVCGLETQQVLWYSLVHILESVHILDTVGTVEVVLSGGHPPIDYRVN